MKNLIYTTALLLGLISISYGQNNSDQNPNFERSLVKYDSQKDLAASQQSVTLQETREIKDWREIKEDQKELNAARKHELKKMRIERNAQNRRFNNQQYYNGYNNNRYNRNNRCNRNYYPYSNF